MDTFENTNHKNYSMNQSKVNEDNYKGFTPNNPCSINLGKTVYYFNKKPNKNSNISHSNVNKKNNVIFESCNILRNRSFKITNKADGSQLLLLNIKLKNLKPNKFLLLGVLIYENNKLYSFKVKKFSTFGLNNIKCKNIYAGQFSFLFSDKKPLKDKSIKIKFVHNYVNF